MESNSIKKQVIMSLGIYVFNGLNTKVCLILLIILLSKGHSLFAQNIDSLKLAYKIAKSDTTRCHILNEMIEAEDDDKIWSIYNEQLKSLCEQNLKNTSKTKTLTNFYLNYLAIAFDNFGTLYVQRGEIDKALKYYLQRLKIKQDLNDKEGIASALNNLGFIYNFQGDIFKALEYHHQSLKLKEEMNDKLGIANSLLNIGYIYKHQDNLTKAISYYQRGLKINEEIGNKQGIATSLNNLGATYKDQGDKKKSLNYYEQSLKIYKEINDKDGISTALNNIGEIYKDERNFLKSLDYFRQSLEIREEFKYKSGVAISLTSIANAMLEGGLVGSNKEDARLYAERSLRLSQELGYPENISKASLLLSKIYSKTGNYKGAYEMHLLYKQMIDSVNNEANKKSSIQKGFQYEYEKKTAEDSVKTVAERKVFDVQLKQEKTQRTALSIGIGLIALFSIFMYNRFRITRKQKQIIELQKIEVDKQKELADSRRLLAESQKEIIEEKQKEILDSIHYAKRIQQAMLTSESYFDEHFKAEYFIYYQPKDIVSGDFYWATSHHDKFYIATADCTGHGVPGAFMSLLNISFLNENVVERRISSPASILNEQRKEIIKALNPKGNENSKDGMDCVLCAFDFKKNTLDFSAANNPLWLIRNNQLIEYKGDKMPVGKYEENAKEFTQQSIDLKKGDLIYTFTDGYADQFGGTKGKKFMYKQLENILVSNHHLPMHQQRDLLSSTINSWKGDNEQVDDILVIGVRV